MKLSLKKPKLFPLRIFPGSDGNVPSQSSTLTVDGKVVGLVEVSTRTAGGKTMLYLHFRPSREFAVAEYRASRHGVEWWVSQEV